MQEISSVNRRAFSTSGVSVFIVLLIVDSLHFVFARALVPYMDGAVSAMYVMLIATVEVGVFGVLTRRLSLSIKAARKHLYFFAFIGFLVGAGTAINYRAVAFIDAGTASMLGKASILFSLAFGAFWLNERLNKMQLIGAGLSVIGLLFISFQPGDYLRIGSLMVIGATFMYALHTAAVKRYGQEMEFVDFFFLRLLFTSFFLVIFAGVVGQLVWPAADVWVLLAITGTVDVVISRSLYYLALRRLTMSLHTILLTISPVLAVLWSYVIFADFPLAQQLLGGVAVVGGVTIATIYRSK